MNGPPTQRRPSWWAFVDVLLNAAIPTAVYQIVKSHHGSDVAAIGLAGVYPGVVAIAGVIRRRVLDPIAGIVLFGLAASAVALLIGGDTRVLLIRESFVTGMLGVACFASLLLPRPLMFYFGRFFAAGNDPAARAAYDGLWQYPRFRSMNRTITVVWGVAFVGEFGVRVALVLTLPAVAVLAIGPFVLGAITIATIAWTLWYVGRVRAAARARGVLQDET